MKPGSTDDMPKDSGKPTYDCIEGWGEREGSGTLSACHGCGLPAVVGLMQERSMQTEQCGGPLPGRELCQRQIGALTL